MRASRPVTRSGGLRPQGACANRCWGAAERAHPQQRSRLREAGAPSSRRPSAAEGALPRERKPARTAIPSRASQCILRHEKPRVARPRSSGGGHAERGLRPQGAQRRRGGTPPRSVNAKLHKGEAAQEPLPMHPAHQIQKSPYPPHYGEDTGIIRSIWAI